MAKSDTNVPCVLRIGHVQAIDRLITRQVYDCRMKGGGEDGVSMAFPAKPKMCKCFNLGALSRRGNMTLAARHHQAVAIASVEVFMHRQSYCRRQSQSRSHASHWITEYISMV